eukprot:TRINITY_DN5269_c0_g1_i2.p1 TRINITY_DN5269_c0_g1~~TRINITY_DN5269_c0_g1_i2.p1  ORF type:complete len:146 (-),score=15.42 TRINITY_DN5269_c0_g1_i2:167-604(-)
MKVLDSNGTSVVLQLFEDPNFSNGPYLRADGIVMLYSLTQRSSWEELITYYHEIRRAKDVDPQELLDTPLVFVGNKVDLEGERQVPAGEVEERIKGLVDPVLHFETSAKTLHNLNLIFDTLTTLIIQNQQKPKRPTPAKRNCLLQ